MNEKKTKKILYMILLVGVFARFIYILAAPYGISKHDLGNFSLSGFSDTDDGHLGFISYLYHFKRLPDFDPRQRWGFYNPPGFHILAAFWYGINQKLGFSTQASLENLQILTVLLVSGGIVAAVKILQELFPKEKPLLYSTAFLSFFPFFTILSGTLNNDAQAFLCSMLAILYSVRWYRDQTIKNIFITAFSLGIGMFTKLNVSLLAFPIGFLFLYSFAKNRKHYRKYMIQFGIFGLVSIPIGMFWPVRNYIRFGMPLNYIPDLKSVRQYVGDFGILERLGVPSWKELASPFLLFQPDKEHNIWAQLIKTALFDEATLPGGMTAFYICDRLLFWLAFLCAGLSIVIWFRIIFIKGSMAFAMKLYFTILFTSLFIGFIPFCFSYPYICTMNFRYIISLLLMPCLAWGLLFHIEKRERIKRLLSAGVRLIICLFIIADISLIIAAAHT